MVVLVGHRGISGGGIYWQITQPDDPDVLTMVFPEQVATDAAVPDVSLPELVGQEGLDCGLRSRESTLGVAVFVPLSRLG